MPNSLIQVLYTKFHERLSNLNPYQYLCVNMYILQASTEIYISFNKLCWYLMWQFYLHVRATHPITMITCIISLKVSFITNHVENQYQLLNRNAMQS